MAWRLYMEVPLGQREIQGSQGKSRNILKVSIKVGNNHSVAPCGINCFTAPLDCSAENTSIMTSFFMHPPFTIQPTPDLKCLVKDQTEIKDLKTFENIFSLMSKTPYINSPYLVSHQVLISYSPNLSFLANLFCNLNHPPKLSK